MYPRDHSEGGGYRYSKAERRHKALSTTKINNADRDILLESMSVLQNPGRHSVAATVARQGLGRPREIVFFPNRGRAANDIKASVVRSLAYLIRSPHSAIAHIV